jgi:hypothetical protein
MGFANRARRSSTLLFERPYYRKNVPDALKQFENKANIEYAADAANIRDMRFRKSNEYNVDYALKNRREDMISQAYAKSDVDPAQAVGIHGRLGLRLSRTGGALSQFGVPKVTRGKVNRAPPPPLAAGAGAAGQPGAAPVAPPVTPRVENIRLMQAHSRPNAVTVPLGKFPSSTSALFDKRMNGLVSLGEFPPGAGAGGAASFDARLAGGRRSDGGMAAHSPLELLLDSSKTPSGDGAGAPDRDASAPERQRIKDIKKMTVGARRALDMNRGRAPQAQLAPQSAFLDWKRSKSGRAEKKMGGTYQQIWDAKDGEDKMRLESLFKSGQNPDGSPNKRRRAKLK